ncbi:glycoside hydrolase family 15 protein [Metallumcola ferriviriculae]|uniref:Glycoside hydrolase family 15 protein n=1 Tax=Metallumcola ferriviriculae TaxID=3039180 RepID=A0AAU0UJR6_9FIRM|nr:glycoside hydrolase family 15 protein [Desulfitibacteraceae bacterium MK1]
MIDAEISKKVLLTHQDKSGAFPAAPNFPPYQYCWLRDGSFIAYALILAGEEKAAADFFNWTGMVVKRYQDKVFKSISLYNQGVKLHPDQLLHTRFTMDGYEGTEPWGNFQLDGYGTYLWALGQFRKKYVNSPYLEDSEWAVKVVIEYLIRFWHTSCLDCWEECEGVHAVTLAALYGGLKSQTEQGFLNKIQKKNIEAILDLILKEIEHSYIDNGHFVKDRWNKTIDSSLIWLALPFEVVTLDNRVMRHTIEEIERSLLFKGGIKRYISDEYYGGGAWLPLTAWLGWYYARIGKLSKAKVYQEWIEGHSREQNLPEQVTDTDCPECQSWVKKWGPVAEPLLWSHAMHIILDHEMKKLN